ncbi:MAG: undecaprenyldiphospho-muramoylpentapeptide beta-N-acetylglucosaminyltransferase [Candidatus Margulisbacteria bacterium]|nr:undecaprenyldiphospho-muramoylpentapeptide beta-N-acetylglucosaminyltransferase [Candidatus Margulisiibacteriota bacterium]
MKIVIVAGGTGGHIYPGIAIAQEIRRREPKASILFLGSEEGLEKDLVAREGYQIKLIKARALLRKFSYKALSAPFISTVGFFQSLKILKEFSPGVLISTGGYASLPVVLAAKLLGIPIYIHEQNVLPGAVNRFCRRLASKVFLTFKESLQYIQGEVVGNPVRREIIEADRDQARDKLKIKGRMILIIGGSQGSRKMNQAIIGALDRLPKDVQIFHIIGNRDFNWVRQQLDGRKIAGYNPISYLYDMSAVIAAADLVVSRAGATAIAEFLVRGIPMILVPFPYAAEDHQRLNAKVIADNGGAVVVEDSEFKPEKFSELIDGKALDYDKMKAAVRRLATQQLLGRPEAAERIVNFIYG